MIVAFTLAVLALQSAEDSALRTARIRLTGPLQKVVFDGGEAGSTRVACDLRAGEELVREVPFPVRPGSALPTPVDVTEGSCEVLGWSDTARTRVARRLWRRPRAVPVERPVQLPLATLLLCLGGTTLIFALRKRASLALSTAAAFGVGGFFLALSESPRAPGSILVLEGDLEAGVWARVRSSRSFAERVDWQRIDRLEVRPVETPLAVDVDLKSREGEVSVLAPGALLHELSAATDLDAETLTSRANALGDFDLVWVRDAGGAWSARLPWKRGRDLPSRGSRASSLAPPGWLASGLPQGIPVIVGRLAGGGQSASGREGEECWVRATGLATGD